MYENMDLYSFSYRFELDDEYRREDSFCQLENLELPLTKSDVGHRYFFPTLRLDDEIWS